MAFLAGMQVIEKTKNLFSVLTVFAALGVCVGLAGCQKATKPRPATSLTAIVDKQTSSVDREIDDAGLYGVLEDYARGTTTLLNPDYATDEAILDPVNGKFTGPIEDLVKEVAADTGYRVIADGEKPGSPIFITIIQNDLTYIGLLSEGFLQAKGRARIIVDQQAKTMTIHYRRHEKSPVPALEDTEV